MARPIQTIIFPALAVIGTFVAVWMAHLPEPVATSNPAQVEREAKLGGYRLIDLETLSALYRSQRENILIVDTRQEWEHRAGHITDSVHFPFEPTRWARWRSKKRLATLLGPDKEKTIVFY